MTDRRFEPDMSGSYPSVVAAITDAYLDGDRVDEGRAARSLDRIANRLRDEADDVGRQFTIERRTGSLSAVSYAVYDETGEEMLFKNLAEATSYIDKELND